MECLFARGWICARPLLDAYAPLRWRSAGLEAVHRLAANVPGAISVLVPHYRNPLMAHVALRYLLHDPRVAEIVVVDDGSPLEEYCLLRERLAPFRPRVRLARFEQNAGAFTTKVKGVGLCRRDWVLLLDCDNTALPGYLDAFFRLPGRDPGMLYASPHPFPSFDFRPHLARPWLDWDRMREAAESTDGWVGALWNDGNYFVPREAFTRACEPWLGVPVAAVDVLFANYIWLSSGNRMHFMLGARYIHRVHDRSSWRSQRDSSRVASRWIRDRIREGLRVKDSPPLPGVDPSPADRTVTWESSVEVDGAARVE
jgi:glycosyltransferase involved in cell wall biosynthesis